MALFNGKNANYYDMDGRNMIRSGAGLFVKLEGGQEYHGSYAEKAVTRYAKFGRSCYQHSHASAYCNLVSMKPTKSNLDAAYNFAYARSSYLVTTTHFFEDSSWSDQTECMFSYT